MMRWADAVDSGQICTYGDNLEDSVVGVVNYQLILASGGLRPPDPLQAAGCSHVNVDVTVAS
jgi:hypothetical protein